MGYKAHGGECGNDCRNLLFSASDLQQMMCTIIVWDMIFVFWFIKMTDSKVIIFYASPTFGGV